MPDPSVGADLHQALDVHAHFAAKVTLDLEATVDHLAQAVDLLLGEVADPCRFGDIGRRDDLARGGRPDAVDIGERHDGPLLAGDVDAGDTCHVLPSPAAACAWGW